MLMYSYIHSHEDRLTVRMPMDPRFIGSNPANTDGFLRAIKIGSISKPHIVIFYSMLEDPLRDNRDTDRQNSVAISHPVSPSSLLGVCCNQSRDIWWINWE
jgi:hypothetical protein